MTDTNKSDFTPWALKHVARGFEVLVLGDGNLRARLGAAWHEGLCFVHPGMMPDHASAEIVTRLRAAFTTGSGDPNLLETEIDSGIGWASLRGKRYKTLQPLADQIWRLYDRLGAANGADT